MEELEAELAAERAKRQELLNEAAAKEQQAAYQQDLLASLHMSAVAEAVERAASMGSGPLGSGPGSSGPGGSGTHMVIEELEQGLDELNLKGEDAGHVPSALLVEDELIEEGDGQASPRPPRPQPSASGAAASSGTAAASAAGTSEFTSSPGRLWEAGRPKLVEAAAQGAMDGAASIGAGAELGGAFDTAFAIKSSASAQEGSGLWNLIARLEKQVFTERQWFTNRLPEWTLK